MTELRVIVGDALRRIGREPVTDAMSIQVLAGGLSGSSVLALDVDGEAMILKVTVPAPEHPERMEQARREVLFYQELASRVPVPVPRCLGVDFNETSGGVVLLSACKPPRPPDEWTAQDFCDVANQLGRFHATFREAATRPDWIPVIPAITVDQCRSAQARWRTLANRDGMEAAAEQCLRAGRLAMKVHELGSHLSSLTPTLCHGDFHTGNLLQGPDGSWIWADWQGVRVGPGVDDLSFFWERAFADAETSPPYDAMVRAYRAGVATGQDAPVRRAQVERALTWSELRSWLLNWPEYLGYLPIARLERVLRRMDALCNSLVLEARDAHDTGHELPG
jgi:Ser/Thr protein kinase RdoA (MazF antagonist)